MSKTTIVPQAGLQVDTKISRKELVDMILDEQEASLEDAVERGVEIHGEKCKAHDLLKSNIADVIEEIVLAKQSKIKK